MTSLVSDLTSATEVIIDAVTSTETNSQLVEAENEVKKFNPVPIILQGFMNFKTNYYDKNPKMFDKLALEQKPKFLVFACSDSRVSPSHVLHFQPGEAFLVCNIANMVPAQDELKYAGTGATIKYAVEALGVEDILVVGHSTCGGIERLMKYPEDRSDPLEFIDDWVQMAETVKAKVIAEAGDADFSKQWERCAREAVNFSLGNLLTYPFVKEAYNEKKVALHGAYYNFVHGSHGTTLELWEYGSDNVIIVPK